MYLITDNRRADVALAENFDSAGNLVYSEKISFGIKTIGSLKDFDGTRDGYFKARSIRVNPVRIRYGYGESQQGQFSCISPNPVFGVKKFLLTGEIDLSHDNSLPYGDSMLATRAFRQAKAKVNSPEWDAGQVGAELRETIGMLRNPLGSALKIFRRVSKRHKGVASARVLSEQWLQYRYGIMPLISDVNAAIALYEKTLARQTAFRKHTSGADSQMTVVTNNATGFGFVNNFKWGTEVTVKTSYVATSNVYYQFLLNRETEIKQHLLGLQFDQMPALLWELVPYSFVVDWFWNVGGWIRAASPNRSTSELANCTSVKTVRTVTARPINVGFYYAALTPYVRVITEPRYTWSSSTLHRITGSANVGYPTFTLDPFNLKRSLDSVALLSQQAIKLLTRR